MTVKQIEKEIKTCTRERDHHQKLKDEYIKENLHHLIAGAEKWITYYEKLIKKYNDMLPDAIRTEEEKMLKKIAKEQLKNKASTIGYIQYKNGDVKGITPEGKRWKGEHNWYGYTDRTLHCYTLRIEGLGVVFTSGTLETVLMTVAQH